MNLGRLIMWSAWSLDQYKGAGKKKILKAAIRELRRHRNYLYPGELVVSWHVSSMIRR